MDRTLEVSDGAWDEMLRHAREAVPDECCGLLLGRSGRVNEIVRVRNIAADPERRFQLNPAEHFAVLRRARLAGSSVLGAYHSHPRGIAVPSDTDRVEAFEDETFVHVIVDPRDAQIAAYVLTGGNFEALSLVRVR